MAVFGQKQCNNSNEHNGRSLGTGVQYIMYVAILTLHNNHDKKDTEKATENVNEVVLRDTSTETKNLLLNVKYSTTEIYLYI